MPPPITRTSACAPVIPVPAVFAASDNIDVSIPQSSGFAPVDRHVVAELEFLVRAAPFGEVEPKECLGFGEGVETERRMHDLDGEPTRAPPVVIAREGRRVGG